MHIFNTNFNNCTYAESVLTVDYYIETVADIKELCTQDYTTLDLSNHYELVSLKGCPAKINILNCHKTGIKNLEGCPAQVMIFDCNQSTILTLDKGYMNVAEAIYCDDNPQLILDRIWENLEFCKDYQQYGVINEQSAVLGLLRVNGLRRIWCANNDNSPLEIVKKYVPLRTMSDIIRCKQELIKAGFKSNARF